MFAIVKIGAKQHTIHEGDEILVDKMPGKAGEALTFDEVLLVSDGKKTSVGKPTVQGAHVTATIVAQEKGEKLKIRRFKAKVRYRRTTGFRAQLTRLKIGSITAA